MPISRRDFLRTGTSAIAAYPAMMALGMLRTAPAHAFDLEGSGAGKHVLILGAGLAGMAAAYELGKLGYRCTILEARTRAGGRVFSVRKGSTNRETGAAAQTAAFDDGQYFNAGPSRIPHHHELTLHYCKELGIPLQVYNNINEATYYFSEGKGPLSNKKVRVREIHNDVRGYTAELLAKAIDQGKVDAELTKEDTQKIIEFLRAEGGLDIDKLYKASDRRGFIEHPGAGNKSGSIANPHKLADIISSGLMDPDFYNVAEYAYELQMTMFQAVGGMDTIAKAFEKKVGKDVRFGCEVKSIQNQAEGVSVTYKDKTGEKQITADLCICTIPLTVLSNIEHNFSPDVSRAIDFVPYMQTGKIGLQFKRRFWEEDEQIYGGITHTNNELAQLFYPSYDYLGKKGILIGYYNFNERAKKMGDLDFAQRQQLALEKGSLIHPQYKQEFETGFSVCWQKTEYSLGGWALYTAAARKASYTALQQPDKQVYFAGEHMTYLNAWMAGAFESARKTVADIHARVTAQRVAYPATSSIV
ncbi:flavin monoamine oxidase family protein [uncultured Chitinophaga sp.]|uniref:flavin monoamine oxidase family protein n=1 Tax=uncultured Chitinophaga sp. TaxID=339340 RepID=UPI0025FC3F6B|nr:flavin monoamine oxidase family protein [uncultured Chitinophaga sp.]